MKTINLQTYIFHTSKRLYRTVAYLCWFFVFVFQISGEMVQGYRTNAGWLNLYFNKYEDLLSYLWIVSSWFCFSCVLEAFDRYLPSDVYTQYSLLKPSGSSLLSETWCRPWNVVRRIWKVNNFLCGCCFLLAMHCTPNFNYGQTSLVKFWIISEKYICIMISEKFPSKISDHLCE